MAVKTITAEIDGQVRKITADIPDDATPEELEGAVRAHLDAQPKPAPIPGTEKLGGAPPPPSKAPLPPGLQDTKGLARDIGAVAALGPVGILANPDVRNTVTGTAKKIAGAAWDMGKRAAMPPEGKVDTAARLAGGPAGPIVADAVRSHVETGKKAVEAAKQGRASEAVGYGLATVTPAVGPMAANAAEKIGSGWERSIAEPEQARQDVAEGASDIGAMALAPKATELGLRGAGAAINKITARSTDPYSLMVRAVKPRSTQVGFRDSLLRSMPEMKAAEAQLGRPIASVEDALEAVKLAKKGVWGQFEKMNQGPIVADMARISRDVRGVKPGELATDAGAIRDLTREYGYSPRIDTLEGALEGLNAELNAYYAKYPSARGVAATANPDIAAKAAKANALRETINRTLDPEGAGAVPREVKLRYGALRTMEGELERRLNVANRQQPLGLSEQVGKWAGAGHVVRGLLTKNPADVAMGLVESQAARWLKQQQTSNALIHRAFKGYKETPKPLEIPTGVAPTQAFGPIGPPNIPETGWVPPVGTKPAPVPPESVPVGMYGAEGNVPAPLPPVETKPAPVPPRRITVGLYGPIEEPLPLVPLEHRVNGRRR